jgi:hypothetical protein
MHDQKYQMFLNAGCQIPLLKILIQYIWQRALGCGLSNSEAAWKCQFSDYN